MKRKKNLKQKFTELAYEKRAIQDKVINIQKSMEEVNQILKVKK